MEATTEMETELEQLGLEDKPPQLPSFSGCLLQPQPPLRDNGDEGRDNQPQRHCDIHLLFPTSYLTPTDDIAVPRPDAPDSAFNHWLDQELDLERLTRAQSWLFLMGRPNPPRPLHRQLAMGRDIVVDERMDMHLVWTGGRIFLKPIPRFLLCSGFWTRCLTCRPSSVSSACRCHSVPVPNTQQPDKEETCRRKIIRQRALGFLFSYIALLRYESDFQIAHDHHLLPKEVTWPAWSRLVREVLAMDNIYQHVDPRFIYGELRLSRLNKLHRLKWPFFLNGYVRVWQRYDDFWHQSFALLTSVIVYIAIVLTAMQVGLATFELGDNEAFHAAAYGFTVFAILGPPIFAAMALILFFIMLIDNWVTTKANLKRRMKAIKLAV